MMATLRRLPSENALLLLLAVLLGLIVSLGVGLFRAGIDFFTQYYRESGLQLLGGGPFGIILILGVGGLIVGTLMGRFIGTERHHGVAGVIESAALAGGRLRYRRMPLKVLMAAFSLGAGASGGPEDPSVQIGSNLGSMLAQWLHVSDERGRLLVAAGAASGIAAAFRAPIAGVFFALEVVLGDFSTGAFGVVVLAAVISSAFTQALNAAGGPELGIRNYALGGLQELPLYALLGVIAAPLSAIFIRVFYWQNDVWHHLHLPRPLKTGLAGVIVGIIAIFLPQIMSTGVETINSLLNTGASEYLIGMLLLLAAAKIIATSISLGGGFIGGVFAPSLFVGATVGHAFGQVFTRLLPGSTAANPATFAMAGMAAMMTGVIRAPITAVILLFELTNDYRLILPLMLATVVCLFLVERLAPEGIYQIALARKGVRLQGGREIFLMNTVKVREVMTTGAPTVPETLPAEQLSAVFEKYNTRGLLVVDAAGKLAGIVTPQDVVCARDAHKLETSTTGDICTREVITVTGDDSVGKALQLISPRDLGRIPVVSAIDPKQIVGLLRRRDIVKAYDIALYQRETERAALRQKVEAARE